MRADRTKPTRYNRRLRRIIAEFEAALDIKVSRWQREHRFEKLYEPRYRDYGRQVEDADRAAAIREADRAAFVNGREIAMVDGRIVLVDPREIVNKA